MLQVGPRQPYIAGVPHVHAPHALGNRPCNPRPFAVQRFEFLRCLPLACPFLGLVLHVGIDGQGAANVPYRAKNLSEAFESYAARR